MTWNEVQLETLETLRGRIIAKPFRVWETKTSAMGTRPMPTDFKTRAGAERFVAEFSKFGDAVYEIEDLEAERLASIAELEAELFPAPPPAGDFGLFTVADEAVQFVGTFPTLAEAIDAGRATGQAFEVALRGDDGFGAPIPCVALILPSSLESPDCLLTA